MNLQFVKLQNPKDDFSSLHQTVIPCLPSCKAVSVSTVCTITAPITNATENMHKVVAHSKMIKWCVVWRHSQHLSHPSLCSLSPSSANTHKFSFPEMCFENRSFLLTVNNQADRYRPTILLHAKTLGGSWSCSSVAQRWSVANHHKHTRGTQTSTCEQNVTVAYFLLLSGEAFPYLISHTKIAGRVSCKNTATGEINLFIRFTTVYASASQPEESTDESKGNCLVKY